MLTKQQRSNEIQELKDKAKKNRVEHILEEIDKQVLPQFAAENSKILSGGKPSTGYVLSLEKKEDRTEAYKILEDLGYFIRVGLFTQLLIEDELRKSGFEINPKKDELIFFTRKPMED